MSSSEEYLDSLLESILNGGKSQNVDSTPVQQNVTADDIAGELPEDSVAQKTTANANKAMSTEEIEEMLMSMGTLGGETKMPAEDESIGVSDNLSLDNLSLENMGSGDASTENLSTDSLATEEASTDDLMLDGFGTEEASTDDLTLDSLGTEEASADDLMPDDLSLDDISLDDMGLEEASTDDLMLDGFGTEETSADDLTLDSLGTEEASADDLMLDDLSLDDILLDDMGLEEAPTDDLMLNGFGTEEAPTNDLTLDSLGTEETSTDDLMPDDLSLDDISLDDMGLEEAPTDDLMLDGFGTEETSADDLTLDSLGTEETVSDDLALDDLSLDDLALEDFGAEEPLEEDFSLDSFSVGDDAQGEDSVMAGADDLDGLMADVEGDLSLDDLSMEETMSEEDIDRLLSGENLGGADSAETEDELAVSDDFALEETGEDDEDLSALLAGMDHDEDLSEINDLLEKSDQGVPADDDMLALLGEGDNNAFDFFADDNAAKEAASIREISPEELEERENPKGKKEKRKRQKKEKKPRKKKGAEEVTSSEGGETDGLESLLETAPEEEQDKPKKQGFGAKLMALLFEGDEDEKPADAEEDEFSDLGAQMGNLTDENKELLQELSDEDKKNAKKKGKKDKKKKKGKKGKGDGEEAVEGEDGEEIEQPEKKPKKKKKKKKEETEEDLLAPPEKKLSRKKVMSVFLFCGTIAACIILLSSFLPNYMQKHDARIAYDHGYYGDVYDLLYGKKLSEEDETLFQKSYLILQMDRKIGSYENYNKMGMRLEALDALISGVARYQELLPKAEQYNVTGEVRARYEQIVDRLAADFGVSETDALDIIASEDDVAYSQRLEAVINGTAYGSEEDMPEVKQDGLLEEEEIISRLEDVEQADGSDN